MSDYDYAKKLTEEAEAETDRREWVIEYVRRNGHSMKDPDTRDFVDSYAKDPEGFEWLKADAEKPKESTVKLLYVRHPVETPCRDIRTPGGGTGPPMTKKCIAEIFDRHRNQVTDNFLQEHSAIPDANKWRLPAHLLPVGWEAIYENHRQNKRTKK